MSLVIKDLYVSVNGEKILNGINLEVKEGEVNALMGPNGAGKSSLALVLMGHPGYKVEKGSVLFDNEDITNMKPDERARKGLFLSFQYPSEISGVSVSNFLRTALNSKMENKISVLDFKKLLDEKMELLKIDKSFGGRYLNDGFSGGEKKKTEMLQMTVLSPKMAILDEPDSGVDTDALKIIGKGVKELTKKSKAGILLITHYNKILEYVKPDKVTVMVEGKIVKEGDIRIAREIEANGYSSFFA